MKIQMHIIKFIFIGLFFFVISISCSTTSKTSSNQVTVPVDYFGIAGGAKVEEYPLLNEMHTVWLRKTFYWNGIEKEKDNFNYSFYDNYVDNAKAQGKKILAILAYAASWHNDGKNNSYISSKNIQHYLNFIEVTVNRYKGKVDAWEIWNEPNWFIFWKGTHNEFFELLRLAAIKIREIDPDAYIVGGSFLRVPNKFIINMNKYGAMENLDALSFHPYDINPKGSIKLLDDFLKIISKIDFKGDIWITEIGYPTYGWYPSRVSLKNLPSYVIKTIAPAAARRTRTLIWYEFIDSHKYGEANTLNSESYFGLSYSNFSKKEGAWAYELCARYLPGTQYAPELPLKEGIKSNIVTLCFTGNESDTNALIIWNDKKNKQKIKVAIPSLITVHDISSADNYSLQDEVIVDVTDKPVFITWQGSSIPKIFQVN